MPQIAPPAFNGFPDDGIRFLRRLKQHNDRDWFREHKSEYEKHVQEPMKALVYAVSSGCRTQGLPLHVKEKSPVMRVYRDIRFSKDKRPFKTHVSAELRRSFSSSSCLLYIHIGPDEALVAAGVWQPERTVLHAWREAIIKEPDRFKKVHDALSRRGIALHTVHSLSAMPRGFQNYSREFFAPWLKLTSFVVERPLQRSDYATPGLTKIVVQFALAARPLFEFAWHVEDTNARLGQPRIPESALI